MPRSTLYDVLGVARDASSVDIASAFRDKLADMKAKPDTSQDYIDAVREAYQTLASPARRAEYDQGLAPLIPVGASRAGAADDAEDPDFDWRVAAFKFGVPALVVIAVIWAWKGRDAAPVAQVVSVTRTEVSQDSPGPSAEPAPAPAAQASPPPPLPGPAGAAMTAEQLFATVSPSVVRVQVGESRSGSGVVIGAGSVVTNCHVTNGGGSITVKSGTDLLSASISIADEPMDLCTLSVPGLNAPAVSIGTVANVRTGQRVYAIGAPMGLELTLSEGIVSSLRELDAGRVIQTTAPVSPGSSGGGLFSTDGQLIGIVTFQHKFGQNLNFALPADWIAEMRNRI